jgi:hypothetical protein
MDNGDSPAWYLWGFGTGLALGVAIAAPDPASIIVPLTQEERASLENGQLTRELERRLCGRLKEAFAESLDLDDVLTFLCSGPPG